MSKVFAHRGASGYAPENTLEAFQLAVQQRADGVELDVHLTRDGELLVAHDEKIDRVSDGSGWIHQMSLQQIKRFDFNRLHPEYEGAKAPLLSEVYELLKPTGLHINVELKNSAVPYAGLEEKLLELAARMGMEDRVIYSSFNHPSMLYLKSLDRSAKCGLLYDCLLIEAARYAADARMDALHPHYHQLLSVEDFCERAHASGIQVNTWTVNFERDMKRVIALGADIIITNYPDRARALFD